MPDRASGVLALAQRPRVGRERRPPPADVSARTRIQSPRIGCPAVEHKVPAGDWDAGVPGCEPRSSPLQQGPRRTAFCAVERSAIGGHHRSGEGERGRRDAQIVGPERRSGRSPSLRITARSSGTSQLAGTWTACQRLVRRRWAPVAGETDLEASSSRWNLMLHEQRPAEDGARGRTRIQDVRDNLRPAPRGAWRFGIEPSRNAIQKGHSLHVAVGLDTPSCGVPDLVDRKPCFDEGDPGLLRQGRVAG